MKTALHSALVISSVLAAGCAPGPGGATMGSMLARRPASAEQAVHTVCPDGTTTFGIDISDHQDAIDWNAVAGAGVQFAFIRASDSLYHDDTQYAANWPGAEAAGIVRGTYQFFRSNQDPIAQADLMLQKMGTLDSGDLPPVADVETEDGTDIATRVAALHQWLDHVEAAVGVKPIIYTGGYFWDASIQADFSAYPLWHAGYTGGDCPSTLSEDWQGWSFWQYTDNVPVDGIPTGGVDGDRFNGTLDQLRAQLTVSPICGDSVCGGGENHDTCPGDCPICETLRAGGGEVSEQGPCFVAGGPQQFMRHVTDAGEDSNLIWTHTTDDAAEANFGEWSILLSEHGHYRIEAYTAAAYAQSKQANYVVHHGAADDSHIVDQSATDGWNLIVDDVELDPADGITVHLADNTGEPVANQIQLVFDAVRVTRLDGAGEGEGQAGEGEGEGAVGDEGEGEGEGGHVHEVVLVAPPKGKGGCAATEPGTAALGSLVLLALRLRRRA